MQKLVTSFAFAAFATLAHGFAAFNKAVEYIRSSPPTEVSDEVKLKVYGLYKQATFGDCPPQGRNDEVTVVQQLKNNAWCSNTGMDRDEAMEDYIALLDDIVPEWRSNM